MNAKAEASANMSATRVGLACVFGQGEVGSEGTRVLLRQTELQRWRRQERLLRPRAQQRPRRGGMLSFSP